MKRFIGLATAAMILNTMALDTLCEEAINGALVLRVVDEKDRPIEISSVQLWTKTETGGKGYTFAAEEQDHPGIYRVDAVPVGRYSLRINKRGFAEYWIPDIEVRPNPVKPIVCRLSEGGKIAGLVTNRAGEPLGGIPVVINSVQCRRDVVTNSEGVFIAEHVPDVVYSVIAEPRADSPYTIALQSGITVGTKDIHLVLGRRDSNTKRDVAATRPDDPEPSLQVERLVQASLRSRRLRVEQLVGEPAPPPLIEKWIGTKFWELDLKDKVVVLEFWGVWCGPCKQQIPILRRLHEKYQSNGLRIIGIHTQHQKERLPDFLDKEPIPYPVAVDFEDRTSEMYRVNGYPTTVVIDRNGEIRAISPHDLEDFVRPLLNEQSRNQSDSLEKGVKKAGQMEGDAP